MVAGFEKVYEIGRIFRNEGSSPEHLQDFTSLEFYWAYQDYHGLMDFTEKMLKRAIAASMGSLQTKKGEHVIDWSKPWPRLSYYDLFREKTGIDLKTATKEELMKKAKELKIETEPNLGKGRLTDLVYKKAVRPTLIQPCYVIDPPVEISPLAKRHEGDPERVERFQLLAGGTELTNGFSELNDPDDQRERFRMQAKLRDAGDSEAMRMDEDYLEAMEHGMPPTAGIGFGDRVFATLVDKPIRETVLFPLVKPK
jgi:lysyl-tRNA synthetase class 2